MPNSTTLESLTIEINGNSQKASEGIGSLVGSLRSLAKGVGTVVPALRSMNTELRALSKINVGNIGKILNPTSSSLTSLRKTTETVKAISKAANEFKAKPGIMPQYKKAVKENLWASWMYGPNPLPTISRMNSERSRRSAYKPPNRPGFFTFEDYNGKDWRQENKEDTAYFNKRVGEIVNQPNALKNMLTNTRNMYDAMQHGIKVSSVLPQKISQIGEAAKDASAPVQNVGRAVRETGQATNEASEASERATPRFQRFFGVMSRIGRIASTMIIRTALKALVKAFSESWNAAYAFSNGINGSFSKSVDAMRTVLYDTTTTVVQTFAPVFQALVPIINAVAGAIQFLCQGIQYLLSLLGLTSDLFGKTASKINKGIGGSGGGRSKDKNKNKNKNKNLLADWDELNVIKSKDNGITGGAGGGGGGYKAGSMAKFVNEEIQAVLSVIVGEALLAVGLILCFTGHIPAGIGLMVIGAAAIAKPLTTDWNKLPNETKRTIATVTTIATGAFLALGLILLCAGQVPLGIGMLAIGAANFMLSMSVSWGAEAESGVRQTVARIMAIGGAGLMAIGLILACCGAIGIGVSMMVAGAAMWYSAYSLDSNAVLELVSTTLKQVSDWFQKTFDDIKIGSQIAWKIVSDWWNTNIGDPIKEKWNAVVTFFATLFGDKSTEGSIAYYANIAWQGVSIWWQSGIAAPLEGAWNDFAEFFSGLFDSEISGSLPDLVNEAYYVVSEWWTNDIMTPLSATWSGVTQFFSGIFGSSETGIGGYFTIMWDSISRLWKADKITFIKNAWGEVAHWFYTSVTMPVGNFFVDLVNGIIDGINFMIDCLNQVNITVPAFSLLGQQIWPETTIGIHGIANLDYLVPLVDPKREFADGGYGIPTGDLFIANEKGAELVGSMNGKTTVANQGQIIEGIQRGVSDANAEQNTLLRQQNDLLRALIEKSGNLVVSPSAEWGEFNQRSNALWSRATGR